MKPRLTHLLFAALAVAAFGLGVAALRFMPGAGKARGPGAARVVALGAPHPAGGAIVTGLRRGLPPSSVSTADAAPPAPQAPAAPPLTGLAPQPAAPQALAAVAPAGAAPQAPAAGLDGGGVEGSVSFPPPPPVRPVELRNAETPLANASGETPLPPVRPRDLAALEAPAPAEPPAPAPPPPQPAQQPPASSWSFPQWPQAAQPAPETAPPAGAAAPAPLYADVPTPPARPADLGKLAALAPASDSAAQTPAGAAAAPAAAPDGVQLARLQEPALRPAPEDAFQPPPPKFGMGDPVFVRIFKQEGQLELWLKKNGRYALYKTFPICKWSGRLGPKIKEADYQSPEGFYSVSAKQLNPHSNYYRAFNVGYPNAFDRQNGRTGGLVMVHGACKSVGCFAMTDRGIEEIYGFVEAALRAGQKEIPVHIFPFRMTEANLARETGNGGGWLAFVSGGGGYAQWAGFWHNLKQGYDMFEQTGEPPVAFACGDHYEFDGGSSACRRVAGW
ncbi:murein L,D-transpeptidase family protein [Methylocystis sp. IM3]|uniref:L,D-transpeptidase family protein n=1 Tax=unclassified Methylocystis TaxID=2625913 RepID=UPI0030FB3580